MPGYVYCLSNKSIPGFLKIGFTDGPIEKRLLELDSATGVCLPFELEFCVRVRNAHALEQRLHSELREFRVRADREFFQLSTEEAVNRILSLLSPTELSAPESPRPTPQQVRQFFDNTQSISTFRKRRVRGAVRETGETEKTTQRTSNGHAPRSNSGARLNEEWKIGARHVLYRKSGNFYMPLNEFPGALCDENGYILFKTEAEYRSADPAYLQIGVRVSVPNGISKIPGYVRMK